MKHIIDRESFDDSLRTALDRAFGDTMDEAQKDQWVLDHKDDLNIEVEGFLKEAVSRVHKPKKNPEKPVLDFGSIQVWVYDSGQPCHIAEHRQFHFGGDDTAGLVYVEKRHGYHAVEHNINNPSTWEWIDKWMRKGFEADGLMKDGKLTDTKEEKT